MSGANSGVTITSTAIVLQEKRKSFNILSLDRLSFLTKSKIIIIIF